MARPIEYNLNDVFDRAMELFWQKGFEGVSMAELVAYTGLNRRTMYALFKDKEGIFKDTLEHYYLKLASQKITILEENPGKKGLILFFQTFEFSEAFKGCLFSNTMGERAFIDAKVYDIPREYFDRMGEQLEVNLMQAKEEGTFHGDPHTMALTLMTLIHGFQLYGKYNHSKADGETIIHTILKMIQ